VKGGGNLIAASSFIDSNSAGIADGGVMALFGCFVALSAGSSVSSKTSVLRGEIYLQASSLAVFGSAIDRNVATIAFDSRGCGVAAWRTPPSQ